MKIFKYGGMKKKTWPRLVWLHFLWRIPKMPGTDKLLGYRKTGDIRSLRIFGFRLLWLKRKKPYTLTTEEFDDAMRKMHKEA